MSRATLFACQERFVWSLRPFAQAPRPFGLGAIDAQYMGS
jgi:hypothetical protein